MIDGDPNQAGYVEKVAYCYSDQQDVFSFGMTEGTADCLAESNKIILPQSMATKLFGNRPALGQVLRPIYKEIGIRKVYGATIGSILWMFNRHYLAILAACFVVAAPFAWYGVQEWLQGFAYKTPMHWWIYALTFLIVTSITFATVTYQCWRTAVKNPTDSIKTE